MRLLPIAAAFAAATLFAASAEAAPPEGGRFQMSPADGGFLRLDRESGATSFCRPSGEGYACRPAAEEGQPAPDRAAEIEKRVAAIEERLKATVGAPPPGAPNTSGPALDLPSDEQLDRVTSFIERAMKRLKQIAQEMQKEDAPADRQRL